MQTTTSLTAMQMTMNDHPATPANRERFRETIRKTEPVDWGAVILRADKLTARAGAVVAALSALYFAPILLSILLKN